MDLCIRKGANLLGSYVAMTRVTHRRHLLIYRPFARELFAKGEKEGPELLLKQLRGELTVVHAGGKAAREVLACSVTVSCDF